MRTSVGFGVGFVGTALVIEGIRDDGENIEGIVEDGLDVEGVVEYIEKGVKDSTKL